MTPGLTESVGAKHGGIPCSLSVSSSPVTSPVFMSMYEIAKFAFMFFWEKGLESPRSNPVSHVSVCMYVCMEVGEGVCQWVREGVCLWGEGRVCLWGGGRGVSVVREGVCLWGEGRVCLWGGGRGVSGVREGVCLWGEGRGVSVG